VVRLVDYRASHRGQSRVALLACEAPAALSCLRDFGVELRAAADGLFGEGAQGLAAPEMAVDLLARHEREHRLAHGGRMQRQPVAHLPDEPDRQCPLAMIQHDHIGLVQDREVRGALRLLDQLVERSLQNGGQRVRGQEQRSDFEGAKADPVADRLGTLFDVAEALQRREQPEDAGPRQLEPPRELRGAEHRLRPAETTENAQCVRDRLRCFRHVKLPPENRIIRFS
jgi:hypothetical protein